MFWPPNIVYPETSVAISIYSGNHLFLGFVFLSNEKKIRDAQPNRFGEFLIDYNLCIAKKLPAWGNIVASCKRRSYVEYHHRKLHFNQYP